MASTTDMINLQSSIRGVERQLARIADALERMSPPPTAQAATTPPAPVAIPADGPNIATQGF